MEILIFCRRATRVIILLTRSYDAMTVMTLFSIKTYSKEIYFKSFVNWHKTVISVMEEEKVRE